VATPSAAGEIAVKLPWFAAVVAAASLAGACAGPAATPSAPPPTQIEVTLTDAMRIQPDPINAPAGVPVRFVVTNTGQIDHEFMLGDEAAQADHEQEMLEPGAMAHDHSYVITVKPGQTKELVYTFDSAGQLLAGCHIPGHYPAGMKATVTVTD
jgi:uncharacterized cupredoxin-like copper-binding protein